VNDADRLYRDRAMRWVVGHPAITGSVASASQMGRFETKWLSRPENLVALVDLPGRWIDKVQHRRAPRIVVLDIDSGESLASVEDIDYHAQRGLDRALFLKLATCDWIRQHRNLLVTGPTGLVT
jgi:DNA replication protein DnaC